MDLTEVYPTSSGSGFYKRDNKILHHPPHFHLQICKSRKVSIMADQSGLYDICKLVHFLS
jgi:hypothetical protein